eukprot:1159608-Pelagomonas_calceolata.AAC.1
MRLTALAGRLAGKFPGGSKRCVSLRCSMGSETPKWERQEECKMASHASYHARHVGIQRQPYYTVAQVHLMHYFPQVSHRVQKTDAPVIVNMKKLMASREDVLSLAQGIVHWSPPPQALQLCEGFDCASSEAKQLALLPVMVACDFIAKLGNLRQAASAALAEDPSVHGYGPAEGLPALREALRAKIAKRNGLTQVRPIMSAFSPRGTVSKDNQEEWIYAGGRKRAKVAESKGLAQVEGDHWRSAGCVILETWGGEGWFGGQQVKGWQCVLKHAQCNMTRIMICKASGFETSRCILAFRACRISTTLR